MPRPSLNTLVDLSNPQDKRRLLTSLGTYEGVYEVKLNPRRETRSNAQLRYYFAVVVEALYEFLRQQDYEISDKDAAHEILKAKFLGAAIRDPRTGEKIAVRVRSTGELNTEQFSEYLERCRAWLADMFGIQTPDPDPNWRNAPCGSSSSS